MFMGFTGLVPSEHSSGDRQNRGGITHAGNTHLRTQLVESAWSYRASPAVGATLGKRQAGVHPDTVARSWTAQQRLSSKFRRLDARKNNRKVVVTAIARELAGFLWAEAVATNT
jgi:hypothetical protein